ncbi:MAG: hypothetical protein AAB662_01900, partial [Patescibacteria group bacterium]
MADGPISPEGIDVVKPPVAPVTKESEASPEKGLVTKLAESQRAFNEAQKEARKEMDLQYDQYLDWYSKNEHSMPVTMVNQFTGDEMRSGIFRGEGGRVKLVMCTLNREATNEMDIHKFSLNNREGKVGPRIEIVDDWDNGILGRYGELANNRLFVASHTMRLRGENHDQTISYGEDMQLKYVRGQFKNEVVDESQVPDVLNYSRETLDFLGKATMQPEASSLPPLQPTGGQPTAAPTA